MQLTGTGDDFVPVSNLIFSVGCNMTDDELLENIATNIKSGIPVLSEAQPANGVKVVIVGGGPSLKRCLMEVRERQQCGQMIFALNGAANYLAENGIKADVCIVIDGRPQNVAFVETRSASYYFLSSQVHPSVVAAVAGENRLMFHQAGFGERLQALLPKGPCLEVAGVSTSGIIAMTAVYALGFREIHLYGYDSCDEDDVSHAYGQEETTGERERIQVKAGGRIFSCSHAMAKQAEHFPRYAAMLAEAGCDLAVHGDGLIPTLAREMTAPMDASRACYDLGSAPASFDFFAWLIIAEMARRKDGCQEPLRIAFQPGPAGGFRNDGGQEFMADRQKMLDHVMRPALKLLGAIEDPEAAATGSVWHNRYTFEPVVAAHKRGHAVPTFKAPPEACAFVDAWLAERRIYKPVVITLRESSHWPHRNSKILNWLRFAGSISEQIIFVRDTEKAHEPFHGHQTCPEASEDILIRCALYERAKCNLFVANGPAALAFFSDRPYLMFSPLDPEGKWIPGTDWWWRFNHGIGEGEQFPWSRADQRIVWDVDSYASIRKAWDELAPSL